MNLLILLTILGLVALSVLGIILGISEAEPLLLWLANLPALGLVYVTFEIERQESRRRRRHQQ